MLNSIISNPITLPELLACLLCAMVLGVFTSLVFLYKSRHSAGFLLTLAMLPMAVAVVILLVNGNIGTGVAVAGAFALVRFRSVPGTAEEIAAIFYINGTWTCTRNGIYRYCSCFLFIIFSF